MTVKGGSRPACAACRFQRRRCSSVCPLAPYFPADQPKVFQNVHRLYGVGNVTKILNQISTEDQKQEAVRSIKYESFIRDLYPVHGCLGTILQLQRQLAHATRELQCVRAELAVYRESNAALHDDHHQLQLKINTTPFWTPPDLEFDYIGGESSKNLAALLQMQRFYCDQEEIKVDNNTNYTNMAIEAQLAQLQPFGIEQSGVTGIPDQDYGSMELDTPVEDRPPYIESKEPFQSSSGSLFEDTTQLVDDEIEDNNLRSAAASFSLTSVSSI